MLRRYRAEMMRRQCAMLWTNLAALGISRLQTEVSWSDQQLLHFFNAQGFAPAPRFCLDLAIKATEAHADERAERTAP